MEIRVRTEMLEKAAEELSSCVKRLRYTDTGLSSSLKRLESEREGRGYDLYRELKRLEEQLESCIMRAEIMADVLMRVSQEMSSNEQQILSDVSFDPDDIKIGISDLDRLSDIVSEVVKQA